MKRQRITDHDKATFLESLAVQGVVTVAARAAGHSRSRFYELREEDEDFAGRWDEAEEEAADALRAEARRRAVEGVERYVVSGGKVVTTHDGQPLKIREYSDQLLLALARARCPEMRDTRTVNHEGGLTLRRDATDLSDEELAAIAAGGGEGAAEPEDGEE